MDQSLTEEKINEYISKIITYSIELIKSKDEHEKCYKNYILYSDECKLVKHRLNNVPKNKNELIQVTRTVKSSKFNKYYQTYYTDSKKRNMKNN